jgi:hypothetical protein
MLHYRDDNDSTIEQYGTGESDAEKKPFVASVGTAGDNHFHSL